MAAAAANLHSEKISGSYTFKIILRYNHNENLDRKRRVTMKLNINLGRDTVFEKLDCLIEAISDAIAGQGRAVVAMDGESGAGKSTAASILAEFFSGEVVHMDDFFLPMELRTEDRLSLPGGNVHYERFSEEVLANINQPGKFKYGVYNCSAGEITSTETFSSEGVLIIEGAYSLRPAYGKYYDVSAFITADKKTRLERIRNRNGEASLKIFEERWIPMEEKYFNAFNIRNTADFIIELSDKYI